MNSITIDFVKAIAQARQLDTIAAGIEKLASQQYDATIRKLSGDWRSENASAFLVKAEKLKSEMLTTASSIKKTAEQVRTTARRIYNAEKRAQEIARTRAAKS